MEQERKIKIISLAAVIVAVLGLTLAFASLSRTLKINGTGNVDPANFDIYFDNLSSPVTKGKAEVSGTPSLATKGAEISNINVTLKQPKDSVTYTVDIINEGDVDAEISGITLPNLTAREQELFEFTAEYTEEQENGTHTISVGDMLYKNESKNITITFKYKDITDESKLPSNPEEITLSYAIQYVQSNKTKTTSAQVVSQTYNVGDKFCLNGDKECFYTISDNGDTVTALAEWNLNVGDNKNPNVTEGIQDESVRGFRADGGITYGNTAFSEENYWDQNNELDYSNNYPFVFNGDSNLWQPVQKYQTYLREVLGKSSVSATLMSYEQAIGLKCSGSSCQSASSWVYQTSYWLGSAAKNNLLWGVNNIGIMVSYGHDGNGFFGIRPVITIYKTEM